MVIERTATDGKASDIKYFASGKYTVTFSTNDTFTATDFVDSENLKFAAIIKNLDGSELLNDVSDNVITCIDTCSDVECTVFVFGVRV
jgi:hypothetical protein